jgi:hypothetical protein
VDHRRLARGLPNEITRDTLCRWLHFS